MVHAKNYEAVSMFVQVMQKKTVDSFFSGHGVYRSYKTCFAILKQGRILVGLSRQQYPENIFWITMICIVLMLLHL